MIKKMTNKPRDWTTAELIERLRSAGSIWFKNEDLLILEELIRRYQWLENELARRNANVSD
jgi:hypothetical protein